MNSDPLLEAVRGIIGEAFGDDWSGSERGPLVSRYYLARIRDVLRGDIPPRTPVHVCAECAELRRRLVNIYHLTINGGSDAGTVRAIRAASGPGAPSPRCEEESNA